MAPGRFSASPLHALDAAAPADAGSTLAESDAMIPAGPQRAASTAARRRTDPSRRRLPILLLMVVAVATVAALAFWDEQRESAAALDEFAGEQAALAVSVASQIATSIDDARRDALAIAESLEESRRPPAILVEGYTSFRLRANDDARPAGDAAIAGPLREARDVVLTVTTPSGHLLDLTVPLASLLRSPGRIERPGAVMLLVLGPDGASLRTGDGRTASAEPIRHALLDTASAWLWLDRASAAALGLPSRRAAAGLARFDAGALGRWGVAVASSAVRVRDRELRGRWRVVLGVTLASVLVLAFGSVALRNQRHELMLERELELATLTTERDERLAKASRVAVMGTLAMGVAHEVSTPLGIIAGRAEQILPRVAGDERVTRSVQAISDQAERIRRTIRGFLDLAHGGSPDLARVAPARVLREAVALVEHRFEHAGVALTTSASDDLPALHCDISMLEQVLVNLLLNACDSCRTGGAVRAAVSSDGERVIFTVTDDGIGITEEAAARALEPFFTTKVASKGTGLGLAIANEIVKLHRGKLSLGPAEPRGTRACVQLPLPKVENHAAA